MSDQSAVSNIEQEIEDDEVDFNPDDDYGFIIGPDGGLKSIMLPENLMEEPPIEVVMILKLFGITDINDTENKTIH